MPSTIVNHHHHKRIPFKKQMKMKPGKDAKGQPGITFPKIARLHVTFVGQVNG